MENAIRGRIAKLDHDLACDFDLCGLEPVNWELYALGAGGVVRGALGSSAARAGSRLTTDIVATRNGLVNVRSTVERIRAGKGFPHRNDGAVFQNREGLLPKQSQGYYREYVHPTPGASGPGAQRVIQGRGGELYYSPDHYRTFIPLN